MRILTGMFSILDVGIISFLLIIFVTLIFYAVKEERSKWIKIGEDCLTRKDEVTSIGRSNDSPDIYIITLRNSPVTLSVSKEMAKFYRGKLLE